MKWYFLSFSLFVFLISCENKKEKDTTSKDTTEVINQKPNTVGYVFSENGLNLRESPTVSSKTILTLPFATKLSIIELDKTDLTIDGIKGNWIKVTDGQNEGYVFDGYVLPYLPLTQDSEKTSLKAFLNANFKTLGVESSSTETEKISESYTENYTVKYQKYEGDASYCNKSSDMVAIDQAIIPKLSLIQGFVLAQAWMPKEFKTINLGSKMTAETPDSDCAVMAKKYDYIYEGNLCVFKSTTGKPIKIRTYIAYEGGATTFTIKDTTNGVYIERYSVAD